MANGVKIEIDARVIEAVASLVGSAWTVAAVGASMPGVGELKAKADEVAEKFCLIAIPGGR